jgi:hypothetical protein
MCTFSFFCEILLHKYHIDGKHVRVKIEMLDLHAVSIFATGTGESDTTTPTPSFASCGTQFIEK